MPPTSALARVFVKCGCCLCLNFDPCGRTVEIYGLAILLLMGLKEVAYKFAKLIFSRLKPW